MPIRFALVTWFAAVSLLGARGLLATPQGRPPLPILAAVVVPLAAFLLLRRFSDRFRRFTLTLDLRLITAIQAWRFAGFAFIALYANGVLPGVFSWPAGLGDMAVAVAAPWMVMALVSRPQFSTSRAFVTWNYLGIADLVVAVTAGAIGSGLVPGLIGGATTAPMARLPLVYVPAFLVPIMIMLHLSAILRPRGATA
jgi:hypothetical protein